MIVDVGCGEGFFAIPVAKLVGKAEKVIGINADWRALEHLKREMERLELHHLTALGGRAEEQFP